MTSEGGVREVEAESGEPWKEDAMAQMVPYRTPREDIQILPQKLRPGHSTQVANGRCVLSK